MIWYGKIKTVAFHLKTFAKSCNSLRLIFLAPEGEITEREFEDKIKEGLSQLGIYVDFN